MIKRAIFILLPGSHILDYAGPLQVIDACNDLNIADIEIMHCSPDTQIQFAQGAFIANLQPLPTKLVNGDVVFVIGKKTTLLPFSDKSSIRLIRWLSKHYTINEDVLFCSVCSGALH